MNIRTFRSRATLGALIAASTVTACFPCCGNTVAGDEAAQLQVEPMVFVADRFVVPQDGAEVPVIAGSQGGLMVIAGVRARNVDTCGVMVQARLLTPDERVLSDTMLEKNLTGTDEQTAEIVDDDGSDGLTLFPCDSGDVHGVGELRILELVATDRNGRTATSRTTIIPTCGQYGSWCEDRCAPWAAEPDAGTDGGTDGGSDAGSDGGS